MKSVVIVLQRINSPEEVPRGRRKHLYLAVVLHQVVVFLLSNYFIMASILVYLTSDMGIVSFSFSIYCMYCMQLSVYAEEQNFGKICSRCGGVKFSWRRDS